MVLCEDSFIAIDIAGELMQAFQLGELQVSRYNNYFDTFGISFVSSYCCLGL